MSVYRLSDMNNSWNKLGNDIDGEAAGDCSGCPYLFLLMVQHWLLELALMMEMVLIVGMCVFI